MASITLLIGFLGYAYKQNKNKKKLVIFPGILLAFIFVGVTTVYDKLMWYTSEKQIQIFIQFWFDYYIVYIIWFLLLTCIVILGIMANIINRT